MTLTDLASLGSFISAIAVAASLIYLALQVHQNSKHTRALIQQGRIDRNVSSALAMADEDLVAAYITGNGDAATPELVKRTQFLLQCVAIYNSWEDGFSQHEDGLLREAQYVGYRIQIVRVLKGAPGVHEGWQRWKGTRADKFTAFIDELVSQAEATPRAVN